MYKKVKRITNEQKEEKRIRIQKQPNIISPEVPFTAAPIRSPFPDISYEIYDERNKKERENRARPL